MRNTDSKSDVRVASRWAVAGRRLVFLGLIAVLTTAIGERSSAQQDPVEAAQLRAALIRAVREDAPATPIVLFYVGSSDTAITRRAGVLANVPVRRLQDTRDGASATRGDTTGVRIQVDSINGSKAVVTVFTWGAMRKPLPNHPTGWFEVKRAELALEAGRWVVKKFETTMTG